MDLKNVLVEEAYTRDFVEKSDKGSLPTMSGRMRHEIKITKQKLQNYHGH
jgi:hypothetical protein